MLCLCHILFFEFSYLGSKLYSMAVEKDKNMAVSIRVADFNKGNAVYFRAHPSLALCLQKVFSKVYDVTKEKVTYFHNIFVTYL